MRAALARARGVPGAVRDGLVQVDVPVADLDVESAVGIGAHPRLVVDSRALPSEVGERDEVANAADTAFRKIRAFHHRPPPSTSSGAAAPSGPLPVSTDARQCTQGGAAGQGDEGRGRRPSHPVCAGRCFAYRGLVTSRFAAARERRMGAGGLY